MRALGLALARAGRCSFARRDLARAAFAEAAAKLGGEVHTDKGNHGEDDRARDRHSLLIHAVAEERDEAVDDDEQHDVAACHWTTLT